MTDKDPCSICESTKSVSKSRKFNGILLCPTCTQKILRYGKMRKGRAEKRARTIVASLMCMVIARRGYEAGYDAATLLNNVLE